MEECTIKNLPDLLSAHLESNKKITGVHIEKLPQNGYGSIMLKIDLKLEDKNGADETEHLVAKVLHGSEEVRKMFKVQTTFKHEIAFYDTILPLFRKFQKENGVDGMKMFAKFCGARINLDGSDEVDDDAAVVLQNLVEAGFVNGDRTEGVDLDTTKLILADLAEFHGTAIALSQNHPKDYYEKVITKRERSRTDLNQFEKYTFLSALVHILKENPQTAPLAELAISFPDNKTTDIREAYATLGHGDLWLTNTMQKFKDGKPVANVFVDFQSYGYSSCGSDLLIFLWSSVQKPVLETKLDELIAHYHEHLVDIVKKLNGDASALSLENFYEELRIESEYDFRRCLLFVFGGKHPPTTDFFAMIQSGSLPSSDVIAKQTPLFLKEYLWFMVLEGHKRGLLY